MRNTAYFHCALGLILPLLLPQTAMCFLNPNNGRWLNRDPLTETGGNNLYSFARNDSPGAFDPDGRISVRPLTDHPSSCCGEATVNFEIRLDRPALQSGWIVQEN